MGKQTDAIQFIKRTFEQHPQLYAVDLDVIEKNPDRMRVTCVPAKKASLPEKLSADLEQEIFEVYSGKKQIAKLVDQRFTREDFSRMKDDEL